MERMMEWSKGRRCPEKRGFAMINFIIVTS